MDYYFRPRCLECVHRKANQKANGVDSSECLNSTIYDEEERGGYAEESDDDDGLSASEGIPVKKELRQTPAYKYIS